MDILFFNTGECDDALRDRDLYLVHNAKDEADARVELERYLREEGLNDPSMAHDVAEDHSVMLIGDNLRDGMAGTQHYCYRMMELDCAK